MHEDLRKARAEISDCKYDITRLREMIERLEKKVMQEIKELG